MEIDFTAILALAFTAWAGVVGYFARGIRADLRLIAANLKAESEKLNLYIVRTESRLAVLEDRADARAAQRLKAEPKDYEDS